MIHGVKKRLRTRSMMRWTMAVLYVVAGIAHLALQDKFLEIVPAWVPWPTQVVIVTGICELAGSAALLTTKMRWLAGVMFALYAICVFPANLKQAVDAWPSNLGYHVPRLLFQPVLVWWALFCASVIDWPFGKRSKPEDHPTAHEAPVNSDSAFSRQGIQH